MRKRRFYILIVIAVVAAIVCWYIGTGAVIALLMLLALAAIFRFFARVYPANRAKEDAAEREDSF
jgi:hypothetical protein